MRVHLMVAASLALAVMPVAAQGGGQGGQRGAGAGAGRGMLGSLPNSDSLTTQLALNEDQQVAVTKLVATFDEATKEARAAIAAMTESGGAGGGDMSAMREHATGLRAEQAKFAEAIKKVLTKDQSTKYDELYPARRGRGGGAGGGGNS